MKKLLISLLLFLSCSQLWSQVVEQTLTGPKVRAIIKGQLSIDSLVFLPNRDTAFSPGRPGAVVYRHASKALYYYDGTYWRSFQGQLAADFEKALDMKVDSLYAINDSTIGYIRGDSVYSFRLRGGAGGGAIARILPAGIITSDPAVGFNPGVNITADSFIIASFYQSRPPTATLSPNAVFEYMEEGDVMGGTINWTAGRQVGTKNISDIEITGPINQSFHPTFSNPSAPGTISGSQNIVFERNTYNAFTNTVTTSDGKIASASVVIDFRWKKHWGFVSTKPPSPSTVRALSGQLSTGKSMTSFSVAAPGAAAYLVYCYPAEWGELSSLSIGNIESLTAFSRYTVSHTNSYGATTNYYYYVSDNAFTQSIDNIVIQ